MPERLHTVWGIMADEKALPLSLILFMAPGMIISLLHDTMGVYISNAISASVIIPTTLTGAVLMFMSLIAEGKLKAKECKNCDKEYERGFMEKEEKDFCPYCAHELEYKYPEEAKKHV